MRSQINNVLGKFGLQITRTNNIPFNAGMLNKYRFFNGLFHKIKTVDGDVVECGVGFGHTLFLLAYIAGIENKNRMVYGFDSFEGFPEPSKEDASIRNPKKGEWKVITQDELLDVFTRRCKLPDEASKNLFLTKGYFEDTLPKSPIKKIAFLHLDCDLYQSYKTCLETLYDKVSQGGVILFDEYKQTSDIWPGAVKAIDEFFSDKKETIQYDKSFDKYFLIKGNFS